jgi:hypothetical protein
MATMTLHVTHKSTKQKKGMPPLLASSQTTPAPLILTLVRKDEWPLPSEHNKNASKDHSCENSR